MNNTFDWLVGTWTSEQRRLKEVLAGSDEWIAFPGRHVAWSVLDGHGSVDEASFPTLGWSGVSLRLYDADTDEWSIYWATRKHGLSLPPVVGRFGDDGVGLFVGDDVHEDRPITVKYVWSDITDSTARWEQAFSTDGGTTWETNWVANFTRVS